MAFLRLLPAQIIACLWKSLAAKARAAPSGGPIRASFPNRISTPQNELNRYLLTTFLREGAQAFTVCGTASRRPQKRTLPSLCSTLFVA
jgi:hypothetical protein